MKQLVYFSAFLFFVVLQNNQAYSQKFLTKTGHAYFMSHTDAIDIDGNNHQIAAIADAETGDLVVIVLIKAFEFTLATADKHFNETYMESDEYPKAVFKGNVPLLKGLNLITNTEYNAVTEGKLTIHGVTKDVRKEGKLIVRDGNIKIECDFNVLIADYDIKVPKSVENRVAQQVDVKIDMVLVPK
jgi:polyisoprenoid-binding protein YceI